MSKVKAIKEAFLQSFIKGEERGFNFFFEQYYAALTLFATSIIHDQCAAEEITSEAFLKVWKHHAQFTEAGNIRSYLYQVVRHDCYRYIKRRNAKQIKEENIIELYPDVESHFEEIVKAETVRALHQSLAVLPSVCRKVFELMYVEGKTVKEISALLELSPSTVKTHKARGLEILRKKFAT